jgi:hypothetical protein
MGRVILIRVRELVSSGVSIGWVGGHWCFSIDVGVDWGTIWCNFCLVKVFSSLCLLMYVLTIPYTSCLWNCSLIKFSRFKKNYAANKLSLICRTFYYICKKLWFKSLSSHLSILMIKEYGLTFNNWQRDEYSKTKIR